METQKINKGLTKIEFDLNRYKPKKSTKYQWQELALEIIEYLEDGKNNKSSIFKVCKQNETRARKCLTDCRELGKPYTKYFFKLINL